MRYVWSRFIVIFLILEGMLFIVYYNYGPRGILVLHELKNNRTAITQEITGLRQQNQDLQEQIEAWSNDIFLQEKYAREKLAMQKEGEKIYYR